MKALVEQKAEAHVIPPMHLNHAWIALERIMTGAINANQIPEMRSLRTEAPIVFAQHCHLGRREEVACNGISLLFIHAFQIQRRKHTLVLSFTHKAPG